MSCLNISRFYSESEYADWLYDFLEELEDSVAKNYAMNLLEEPYDDTETSDNMFSALYLDDDQRISEAERIKEIFLKERGSRYKPGSSLPWK
jgi:hypothetical protein